MWLQNDPYRDDLRDLFTIFPYFYFNASPLLDIVLLWLFLKVDSQNKKNLIFSLRIVINKWHSRYLSVSFVVMRFYSVSLPAYSSSVRHFPITFVVNYVFSTQGRLLFRVLCLYFLGIYLLYPIYFCPRSVVIYLSLFFFVYTLFLLCVCFYFPFLMFSFS